MKVIKFYRNWNNKLGGIYFTTLRKKDGRSDKPGDIYKVLISDVMACKAELVAIYDKEDFMANDNPNNPLLNLVLRLDTGYSVEEAHKMYGRFKMNLERDDWVLLLFRKLRQEEG